MTKFKPMSWKVKRFDSNAQKIEDYDVLLYLEDEIKKMKKKDKTKEEFGEDLRSRLMWQYWSRCEYEIIITRSNEKITLSPWVGCYNPEGAKIDVTNDVNFDWSGFADKHIWGDNQDAKVDIYDQIMYRWDEFLDYCWNYHHKYQRKPKN